MVQETKQWNQLASCYKEFYSELNEVDEALSIIHKLTDSYVEIEVIPLNESFKCFASENFEYTEATY